MDFQLPDNFDLSNPITQETLAELGIISDEQRRALGLFSLEEIEEMQQSQSLSQSSANNQCKSSIFDENRIPALTLAMMKYGIGGNIGRHHSQYSR